MKRIARLIGLLFLIALCGALPAQAEKQVVGWLEKAKLVPGDLIVDAKVDTGADNTSVDARNVTSMTHDGKTILRFEMDDRKGRTVTVEKEQVGIEPVPQHQGEDEERPLVIMEICLGNTCKNTLVNLADRSRHKYPLLIGRSFLLDRFLVDPASEYLVPLKPTSGSRP